MDDWPFADPPNLASITVRQFVRDDQPILLVVHDPDDGGWQFLTGGAFDISDGLVISLAGARDRSLAELTGLPLSWQVWREAPGAPWQRGPYEESDV
jgi:hypothetical protein